MLHCLCLCKKHGIFLYFSSVESTLMSIFSENRQKKKKKKLFGVSNVVRGMIFLPDPPFVAPPELLPCCAMFFPFKKDGNIFDPSSYAITLLMAYVEILFFAGSAKNMNKIKQ